MEKTVEVHEDFKEFMDAYEDFFDEYVELMNDDDPDAFALLEFMSEYNEAMETIDALGDVELSEGDMAYYFDVHGRIMAALATVG